MIGKDQNEEKKGTLYRSSSVGIVPCKLQMKNTPDLSVRLGPSSGHSTLEVLGMWCTYIASFSWMILQLRGDLQGLNGSTARVETVCALCIAAKKRSLCSKTFSLLSQQGLWGPLGFEDLSGPEALGQAYWDACKSHKTLLTYVTVKDQHQPSTYDGKQTG